MKKSEKPVVSMPILRRDLYLLVSMLLADKRVAMKESLSEWTAEYFETEANRMVVWVTTALRGLLDLQIRDSGGRLVDLGSMIRGVYWDDFQGGKMRPLTFRQACNSAIHAKVIWLFEAPESDLASIMKSAKKTGRETFDGSISIYGVHRNLQTRADIDMMQFVEIAHQLIKLCEENHANLPNRA